MTGRPDETTRLSLVQTIRADIEATTHENFRTFYSPLRFWLRALTKLVVSANVRTVVIYRIAHTLARRRLLPLALLLREWGIRSSGAELNPLANIGPGFYLVHSIGVGVGANVDIGKSCKMHLGAVVGPQPLNNQGPRRTVIGDDVYIGTHAVIIGGVTVGDGAVIGANAVVMRDVPAYAIVSAMPAKTIGTAREPSEPA